MRRHTPLVKPWCYCFRLVSSRATSDAHPALPATGKNPSFSRKYPGPRDRNWSVEGGLVPPACAYSMVCLGESPYYYAENPSQAGKDFPPGSVPQGGALRVRPLPRFAGRFQRALGV